MRIKAAAFSNKEKDLNSKGKETALDHLLGGGVTLQYEGRDGVTKAES